MKIIFNNELETISFAKKLASNLKTGNVVRLVGTLGSGKSLIARTIIQELGTKETHIPSPTFTLVQTYNDTTHPIAHMDLYRLEEADEIFDLDIEYYLENGILLIEWPEVADIHLPKNCITIEFEPSEDSSTKRVINLTGIEL